MKDAYELLHQKESALARVRKEIESLNIVAPLLADDRAADDPAEKSDPTPLSDTISRLSDSAATNADSMFASATKSRPGFLNALKRAR
jgi:hypothetical protein